MKRLWMGVRRRAVDALNLDMMSESYNILVLNYLLLVLYTTLESVFVNTLLYTVMDDISIVIFYRAIVFFSTAVMMHPAAYLGKKKSPIAVIKAGGALYMVTYALLFFGMNHMRYFMVPVAVFSGAGGAFYWSAHTQLVTHYTTKRNRDMGIAILGIVQGMMTLLVPLVSGSVISAMPGTTGYRVMFGVGMAAVAGQLMVHRRMAPVEQKKHESKAKLAFRLLRKKRTFQLMVAYEGIRGFRDGAFGFLLNMVLFGIVTNELLVGINTFLTGAAAIVGNWVYGRVVSPQLRGKVSLLSVGILTLCCLPLFVIMNPFTVMTFTLVSSFFTLFIVNAGCNTSYDVMGQNEITRSCMGEVAAIREGALDIGRLMGLVLLMSIPHTNGGFAAAILILTSAQFLCGVLIMVTQRTMTRKQNKVALEGQI